MLGNDCKVDSKGYIIPLQYINKTEQAHFHKRLINYSQKLKTKKIESFNVKPRVGGNKPK